MVEDTLNLVCFMRGGVRLSLILAPAGLPLDGTWSSPLTFNFLATDRLHRDREKQ